MAPKKGGKKGGKKKKVDFDASEEACAPFGFRARDIVKTPVGMEVTIIGVKLSDPADPTSGRLWAKYGASHVCPLGPKSPEEFQARGYRKADSSAFIIRDIGDVQAKRAARFELRIKAIRAERAAAAGGEEGGEAPKAKGKGKGKKKKK